MRSVEEDLGAPNLSRRTRRFFGAG
jgi:hypothetical protein